MVVDAHEFVCLLGPSGCGKTTTLRLVAGLVRPDSGSISFSTSNGELIESPLRAMVFQDHGVFPWMNVVDNIAFGLEAQGVPARRRRELARSWLEKMHLKEFAAAYPHQLSGGMRQRTGLARAFLTQAPILLMDEPFGNLDALLRVRMQTELLRHWQESKMTVLYVTHDIDEALLLGDRVMVMGRRPGQIIETYRPPLGRPRNLRDLSAPEVIRIKWRIWDNLESSGPVEEQVK